MMRMPMPVETYHVTKVRRMNDGRFELYGHNETTCDPSGCAGFEFRLGECEELSGQVDLGNGIFAMVPENMLERFQS